MNQHTLLVNVYELTGSKDFLYIRFLLQTAYTFQPILPSAHDLRPRLQINAFTYVYNHASR